MAELNTTRLTRRDYWTFLLLLILGLTAHLIRLNYWTPLPDEINYARCARSLLENRTLFSNDIMFFPPLFVYLSALLQLLGAELLTSVRLISACAGALIIPLLYFTARTLFPPATALGTTLLTLPLFSLHLYSRLGQVEILMLFFIILSLLLLLRALPSGSGRYTSAAGIALGLGLWTKETTLGTIAAVTLFILLSFPNRLQTLGRFLLGLLPPALPLFLFSLLTGQNLLLEIMASRGYDINMLRLDPVGNLLALIANLGYNLVPRLFHLWEFLIFSLLTPAVIVLLLITLIRGVQAQNLLSRLILLYLAIHLPFFFLFTRKFDYYLLPSALLVLFNGGLTILSAPNRHPLRRTGLLLLTLLGIYNIYAGYFLYFNRGTHATFEVAVRQIPPRATVATSHPSLVAYLSKRARTPLQIQTLFETGTYRLRAGILTDTTISAVLLKDYYYRRLSNLHPDDWNRLNEIFPIKKELIDYHWTPFTARAGSWKKVPLLNRLSEFAKPVGTVILKKPEPSIPPPVQLNP